MQGRSRTTVSVGVQIAMFSGTPSLTSIQSRSAPRQHENGMFALANGGLVGDPADIRRRG